MSLASRTRVGWGVLGTGHIASVFARDLALLPEEAKLVAVGSRTLAKAEEFAGRHRFARAYGSYAALAEDPKVDVVYLASPHSDHAASVRLCLEAGKAVLVEKPMTTSPDDTDALLALAAERGVFVLEAMWTRTNPLIRRAAALVAAGELGGVRHLDASFGFAFSGPPEHRLLDPGQAGGAILDAGVYPVHAVDLFLGEPDEVSGSVTYGPTGVDTHAAALLSFSAREGRPSATASVLCTLEAQLPSRLAVYGDRGRILIDDFFLRPERMLVYRGNDPHSEPEVLITQWPGGGYTFQAQEVMRCLRHGERESPLVPWRSTAGVARTLARWQAARVAPRAEAEG